MKKVNGLQKYITSFFSDRTRQSKTPTLHHCLQKLDTLVDTFLEGRTDARIDSEKTENRAKSNDFGKTLNAVVNLFEPEAAQYSWEKPLFLELPSRYRRRFLFPPSIIQDVVYKTLYLKLSGPEDYRLFVESVRGGLYDYAGERIRDSFIGERAAELLEKGANDLFIVGETILFRRLLSSYQNFVSGPAFIKTKALHAAYRVLNRLADDFIQSNLDRLGCEIDFFKALKQATTHHTLYLFSVSWEDIFTLLSRFARQCISCSRSALSSISGFVKRSAVFIRRTFVKTVFTTGRLFAREAAQLSAAAADLTVRSAVSVGMFFIHSGIAALRFAAGFTKTAIGSTVRIFAATRGSTVRIFAATRGSTVRISAAVGRIGRTRPAFSWKRVILLLPIPFMAIMIMGETIPAQAQTGNQVKAGTIKQINLLSTSPALWKTEELLHPERFSGSLVLPIELPRESTIVGENGELQLPHNRSTELRGLFYFEDRDIDFNNRIHLTFDDGPNLKKIKVIGENGRLRSVTVTGYILDVLKRHDCAATFFINGHNLLDENGNPVSGIKSVIERIIAEGHTIANHSFHHHNLAADIYNDGHNDITDIKREIRATQEALDKVLGYHYKMTYFRPPYAEPGRNQKVDKAVRELDLEMILFQIDSFDYRIAEDNLDSRRYVLSHLKEELLESYGGIVLMHELPFTANLLTDAVDTITVLTNERGGFSFTSISGLLVEKYHPAIANLGSASKESDSYN